MQQRALHEPCLSLSRGVQDAAPLGTRVTYLSHSDYGLISGRLYVSTCYKKMKAEASTVSSAVPWRSLERSEALAPKDLLSQGFHRESKIKPIALVWSRYLTTKSNEVYIIQPFFNSLYQRVRQRFFCALQ